MQPNFTLKKLGYVGVRIFALALIIGLTTQTLFSQKTIQRLPKAKITPQQEAALKSARNNVQQLSSSDNDAGLPNRNPSLVNPNQTEAVCTTFNVNITSSDPAIGLRGFRDGTPKTCAVPGTCTAGIAGSFNYQIFQWTNPSAQCVTVDYTATNSSFGFVTVHNAPPTLTNLCANWVADPGSSSTLGVPITFSFNGTAGTTYYFLVTNVGAPPSSCTITINAADCGLTPCSGPPAPGMTMSSATTACAGTNFTLTLQNNPPVSGLTYQWQSGPSTTGPWTDIPGATNNFLSRNHTAATYYRCNVACSAGTPVASTPVFVDLTPAAGCYCIPPAVNCTDDDEIIRVRISTLDNASGCSTGPPAGYGDYTSSVAAPTVYSGAANPITVNFVGIWSHGAAVWIDYNRNGSFEASEFTSIGTGAGSVSQLTANINIPASALTGVTRMRVRTRFGATAWLPGEACTNPSAFGETEDYNVNIQPCVPVTFTSSPSNATITCGSNTSFTASVVGSIPTFSWEYRVNSSSAWQVVPVAAPYTVTSTATSTTLSLADVSQAYSGYQYRAVVTGGCSAIDVSGIGTLTVNSIVPVVNPTSATICLNTVQQLSLTNTVALPQTVTFNATTGLPLAIPDNTAAGVLTSPITVSGIPAGSVIRNVSVKFTMTHTWAGDAVMNIKAPNNQILNLFGLIDNLTGGNSTANFTNTMFDSLSTTPIDGAAAPRSGTYAASRYNVGAGALAAGPTTTNNWLPLYGTVNGDWALAMSDLGPGDFGNLLSWSISITFVAPSFAQGIWTGPAGTMFTDATALNPYTGTPATTIYVKPTVTSNYQVSFTTATPCTSTTTTVPVNVVVPVTNIADPTNGSACIGSTKTFTSATATGGPFIRQWQESVNNGLTYTNIVGATGATLTLTGVTQLMNNNLYRIGYTAAPCLGTTYSNPARLTVNALPVVAITAPDLALTPPQTTVVTGTSNPAAAAAGWSWTLNGSAITGTTNSQNVNIGKIGTYQATVTDINGCVGKSNKLEIGSEASDRLWIYPNPTTGQFQVRLYYDSDVTERRIVTIYNMIGQVITSRHFTLANNTAPYLQMDFDLQNMQRGTYLIKVAHEFTGKVVSGLVLLQ